MKLDDKVKNIFDKTIGKIVNNPISRKIALTGALAAGVIGLYGQTQHTYDGEINASTGIGLVNNVKTTITEKESGNVVFTDTIRSGYMNFLFNTTGIGNNNKWR